MPASSAVTAAQILDVFTDEIAAHGGRVTETYHEKQGLFVRSVLPREEEVRPSDPVQGGVALKATRGGVWLYPYVFRQVCQNGAIMAHTLAKHFLEDLDEKEPAEVYESIREGVTACCNVDVFLENTRKFSASREMNADLALNLLPILSELPASVGSRLLPRIFEEFFREGDGSQFGLANAVTAVARDTSDPDMRWKLEEFGGGIAVSADPRQPIDGASAAAAPSRQAVGIG